MRRGLTKTALGGAVLCFSSWASATMDESALEASLGVLRNTSHLEAAAGASLLFDRDSLLGGWFDLRGRDQWINTEKLSQNPAAGSLLHLDPGQVSAAMTISSGVGLHHSGWVNYSHATVSTGSSTVSTAHVVSSPPITLVLAEPLQAFDIPLSEAPLVVDLGATAVPLPAAGWLLLSGIGSLLISAGRRRG